MLIHDSRREARTDGDGNMLTLEEQDRSLWDREKIAAGERLLRGALTSLRAGAYQVHGAISAVHAGAPSTWTLTFTGYGEPVEVSPPPADAGD